MSSRPPQAANPTELVFRRFAVEVVDGDDTGKRVVSEGPELQIGTAASNEMVLTDSTVSRHHCVVVAADDGFLLTDLDSLNGVKLGSYRIHEAFLKDRAMFRLGRVKVSFSLVEGDVHLPLDQTGELAGLVAESSALRRLFARCRRVAQSSRTVLVEGERGTGKRSLAHAIWSIGARASLPFVELDVAALAPRALDDALFGAEGAIARAGDGTLYLASVGDLSPEHQERLGEALDSCTARVIAGSSYDIRPSVNRGRFRADLYHRLAAVRLHIPPLRDRAADIAPIARQLAQLETPEAPPLSEELCEALTRRAWPTNADGVREALALERG